MILILVLMLTHSLVGNISTLSEWLDRIDVAPPTLHPGASHSVHQSYKILLHLLARDGNKTALINTINAQTKHFSCHDHNIFITTENYYNHCVLLHSHRDIYNYEWTLLVHAIQHWQKHAGFCGACVCIAFVCMCVHACSVCTIVTLEMATDIPATSLMSHYMLPTRCKAYSYTPGYQQDHCSDQYSDMHMLIICGTIMWFFLLSTLGGG